jgi:hypothetical protein
MKGVVDNLKGHRRLWGSLMKKGAILLIILTLPVLLGAWQDISGNTINPRFVKRIKDGKTTKHEILLYFGDPQEVDRTPEGPVFKYFSYKDAPLLVSPFAEREINPQSDRPFVIDEKKQIKKKTVKKTGKILRSTLTVRFKPDGETVLSHEYEEY